MSTNNRIDKQFVILSSKGMLLSNKIECTAGTGNSVNEPQQCHIAKRTQSQKCVLRNSIYINVQKKQNEKSKQWVPVARREGLAASGQGHVVG